MKRILIKLSGELFSGPLQNGQNHSSPLNADFIQNIITQIQELHRQVNVCLLVGGGNFFRGEQKGKKLGIEPTTAHDIGMLATLMNGLALHDFLKKAGLSSLIMSPLYCPAIAQPLSNDAVNQALQEGKIIIFCGGTGNPFFTTDTAGVVRSLQIKADVMWKATKVNGVYSDDPVQNPQATLFKTIHYKEVLDNQLRIMDLSAITLAQKHALPLRVFNIFTPQALIKAYKDENFGSTIK